LFEEILTHERKAPTEKQKAWLEKAREAVRPRALESLKKDFQKAAEDLDFRGLMTAEATLLFLERSLPKDEQTSGERQATIKKVREQVLSGKEAANPVWKVTDVKGERLAKFEGSFSPNLTH